MVTEQKILDWQREPDKSLAEAIQKGEVLLISKDRQQQIVDRLSQQALDLGTAEQQLADTTLRYQILTGAIFILLKSCEGIAQHAPEAIALFQELKLTNSKGDINWSAVMGLAGDFLMNKGRSKQIKSLLEQLKGGFDQALFATIPFPEVLGILHEHHLDLSGYAEVVSLITSSQLQKEALHG
jgi:hypothetical protein